MLSLSQVTKSYPGNPNVLSQISLELDRGEFLFVVGGTGAGKTSLLKILVTEEFPSEGRIQFFGRSLEPTRRSELSHLRMQMGYIPQEQRLISDLTVLENLEVAWRHSQAVRVTSFDSAALEILDRLGLRGRSDVLCTNLSGGEAQRVAFARALIRKPELIVADEPTGAQDREFTWAMMDLLVKASQQGTTVVMATHDRELVRRVRKRTAYLQAGHLHFEEAL